MPSRQRIVDEWRPALLLEGRENQLLKPCGSGESLDQHVSEPQFTPLGFPEWFQQRLASKVGPLCGVFVRVSR